MEEEKITVGDFIIQTSYGDAEANIGIYRLGGEGGDFSKSDFEELVRKFYEDNF